MGVLMSFCVFTRRVLLRLSVGLALCCAGLAVHAQTPAPARMRAGEISFLAGMARVDSGSGPREARAGDAVFAGDRFTTGASGHVHIKTVDDGFLALRPNSRARIDLYEFNSANPPATRIRLTLEDGVLRAVSGTGAQAARDKFRLNTPVAAIGIRGTDFTVSTTDSLTRAVVQKGEIVLAALDGDCRADALGPCQGGASRALTAEQAGKLLEVRRGQREPLLIDVRTGTGAPDQIAPPASAEPRAASPAPDKGAQMGQQAAVLTTEARLGAQLESAHTAVLASQASDGAGSGSVPGVLPVTTVPPVEVPVQVPVEVPAPAVNWGRWAFAAGQAAPVDPDAFLAQHGQLVAMNPVFMLAVSRSEDLRMPETGQFDFKLGKSEAYVTDAGNVVAAAAVQGGQLSVDFARQRFATRLDVSAFTGTYALQAQGQLTADGRLASVPLYTDGTTNMAVRGALGGATGTTAAYLFDYALDARRGIVGATSWQR